jgi:UDP-N-acetylmuramoyl-L-alanine---L-glutamate ligase
MRPPLSWADLAGRRVGVWGLGVEGRANLRRLRALGVAPVLVDDRGADAAGPGEHVIAREAGGLEALAGCEVVVKSPGISRYGEACRTLVDRGVAVVGGLGLWLQGAPRDRVMCVTGTKGKSTTTAIAGHLLTGWGYRVMTGGNLGVPPWDPEVDDDADYWVIETSSYQATDVATSPPVVVVTSLHADHLNWHGDEETYYRDKLSLCTRPGARVTVANGRDPRLRARAALLGPEVRWVEHRGGDDNQWVDELGLLGEHNRLNAVLARVALTELGVPEADDPTALERAARGFEQLDSRLRVIGHVGGVDFVDDSLSTNVLPTLAAVDAFADRRVALIAGGYDRMIDYRPLAAGLRDRTRPLLVLTLFASGARIAAALAAEEAPLVEVRALDTLEAAVQQGFAWALPDGVVLLSPAAASFGPFRDYRHRARAFAEAMATCAADLPPRTPHV